MNLVTRRIKPNDQGYLGLIAHEYAPGRELVVYGSGPEAEKVLREAVEKGAADRD